jgi:hypothetical protein
MIDTGAKAIHRDKLLSFSAGHAVIACMMLS